jgi:hypothetical protein
LADENVGWHFCRPTVPRALISNVDPSCFSVCLRYVPVMSDNVQSAMLEILKRIQSDLADVKDRVVGLDGRVARLEDLALKQRRDSAAMLVMMRGTVGVFTERMDALENEVTALKER